jgi:hypothetical protein
VVPTASSPKLWFASPGVGDRVRITVLATVRFFGFPVPTSELSLFPCSFESYFANRPLVLRPGSSVLVRLSFRVPALSRLLLHLSMEAFLPKVLALFATSPACVHCRKDSQPLTSFRP